MPVSDSAKIIHDINERFPMPDWELARLKERRWVLELLPKGGIGLEVGVFRGHFSEMICEIAQPAKLYLVDPWTLMGETFGWGKAYTNFDTLTTAAAKADTEARVAQFSNVDTVVIEGMYPKCRDLIADTLDWAYLDASHQYESTLNELNHLQKQVKPTGFIIGDDWEPRPDKPHHGVYLAVMEFVEKTDWELLRAGPGRQWAIRRKT